MAARDRHITSIFVKCPGSAPSRTLPSRCGVCPSGPSTRIGELLTERLRLASSYPMARLEQSHPRRARHAIGAKLAAERMTMRYCASENGRTQINCCR